MNRFVKMFLCMSIVAVVLQNSLSIRAATKDSSVVTSYIYVNAGSTAYSTETSTKIVGRPLFYMRLKWFKFQYYPENSMPAGRYIYARLCEAVTKANASGIASFSGTTVAGNYNYTSSMRLSIYCVYLVYKTQHLVVKIHLFFVFRLFTGSFGNNLGTSCS